MTKRTKPVATPTNSVNIKKVGLIIIGALVALSLVWGVIAILNNNSDNKDDSSSSSVHSPTGKSMDEDKQDAVKAATALLTTANISPDGKTGLERTEALDKKDMSVVDKKLETLIHFGPGADEEMKIASYQSLITLASMLEKNGKIDVADSTSWKNSYADPALGTVFVPLVVYTGPGTGFSLEMVYVDGQWKLAPYSLLDAVRLSALIGGQPN